MKALLLDADSARRAQLADALLLTKWACTQHLGRPPFGWTGQDFDLVVAHNTDIENYFPGKAGQGPRASLVEDIRRQGPLTLVVLHTHSWNGGEHFVVREGCGPSGDVTVLECGSDALLRNSQAFLREWNDTGRPAVAVLRRAAGGDGLAALSVLCQGYIVAHVAPNVTSDGEGRPRVKAVLVESALASAEKRLGWIECLEKNVGSIPERIVDPIALAAINAEVCRKEYWKLIGAGALEVTRELKEEWGSGNPEGLEKVLELVANVFAEEPIRAEAVGEAYLAISKWRG